MTIYKVKKVREKKNINVKVPGSKSITNRALMLAAISDSTCKLSGVLFSDDSRAFLDCLEKLGFEMTIDEECEEVGSMWWKLCFKLFRANEETPNETTS